MFILLFGFFSRDFRPIGMLPDIMNIALVGAISC